MDVQVEVEQHAGTGGGDAANEAEELVHLGARHRRRGLVEHEQRDVLLPVLQRAHNGEGGLLERRQVGHRLGHLDVPAADPAESLPRGGPLLAPADPPAGSGGVTEAQRQVVDAVERVDQPEVLMNEAKARRVGRRGVAEPELGTLDRAGGAVVGVVKPGENLDEGRLARSVLADERVHLADAYLQAHVVQGLGTREGLADVVQAEDDLALVAAHRSNTTGSWCQPCCSGESTRCGWPARDTLEKRLSISSRKTRASIRASAAPMQACCPKPNDSTAGSAGRVMSNVSGSVQHSSSRFAAKYSR